MFRRLFFIFFISAACNNNLYSVFAEIAPSSWRTEKSQHFIVYYQEAPSGHISELIAEAERYYNDIVDNLGYRRFEFWSWDNRAKIYLYRNSPDYLKETQRNDWSGASVNVRDRTIQTFIGQENFFDTILPHEMTHIIFREFVGINRDLPLWLDEGVACSQEKSALSERLKMVRNLIKQKRHIALNKLSSITADSLIVPSIFYSEASSLIVFLLERYGRDKFLDFSRKLREEENWQEALESIYRFRDLDEFETRWKEYFSKQ